MKAILIIPSPDDTPGPSVPCLSLFPIIDRPFVQRVIETLTARGIVEIHILLHRGAHAIEEFLGNGDRWGCRIAYHLVGQNRSNERVMRAIAANLGKRIIIGRVNCLPSLPEVLPQGGDAVLYGSPKSWTGWAVLDASELVGASMMEDPNWLPRHLGFENVQWKSSGRTLTLRTISDVPAAQRAVLTLQADEALIAATKVKSGVWVARGVSIAPTAKLEAPVFIGHNSVVYPHARIGPYAVIGPNCMIDHGATICNSTVCQGTYVGPGIGLDGVIVDGSLLVQPEGPHVSEIDPLWLDRTHPRLHIGSILRRLIAMTALIFAFPLLLLVAVWLRLTRPGPVFWRHEFVRTPVRPTSNCWDIGVVYTFAPNRCPDARHQWIIPATWRGFILELLPAIAGVAFAGLNIVGLPPRHSKVLREHASHYPALLDCPPGLITEASLHPTSCQEDSLLTDAYQAQTCSIYANSIRALRFLGKMVVNGSHRPQHVGDTLPAHSLLKH